MVEGLIGLVVSKGRGFILATTNKAKVEQLIGTKYLDIVEKPFNLEDLAKKVIDSYNTHKVNFKSS